MFLLHPLKSPLLAFRIHVHGSIATFVWSETGNGVPLLSFYRAMHCSAKRGLAITCRLSDRLSVRLSLTLLDHEFHDHIS